MISLHVFTRIGAVVTRGNPRVVTKFISSLVPRRQATGDEAGSAGRHGKVTLLLLIFARTKISQFGKRREN